MNNLVFSTLGAEDPATGRIAVALTFNLPPLLPGGLDYMAALADFFSRRLGRALAHGRVATWDEHEESPAAHLRNAAQILVGIDARGTHSVQVLDGIDRGTDYFRVTVDELRALGRRIAAAVEQLETDQFSDVLASTPARQLLQRVAGESPESPESPEPRAPYAAPHVTDVALSALVRAGVDRGTVPRAELLELGAIALAALCNDVVDEAALERSRVATRAIASWRETQARNPSGFKSLVSELTQLSARYPDLAPNLEAAGTEGTEP